MKVIPSGIVFLDTCEIQTKRCVARLPFAITTVKEIESNKSIKVCSQCLSEKMRLGEWEIEGAEKIISADMILKNHEGKVILVIEFKNKEPKSRAEIISIYKKLIVMKSIPFSKYVMLVTPINTYVWKPSGREKFKEDPFFETETKNILDLESGELENVEFSDIFMQRVFLIHLRKVYNQIVDNKLKEGSANWLYKTDIINELKKGFSIQVAGPNKFQI